MNATPDAALATTKRRRRWPWVAIAVLAAGVVLLLAAPKLLAGFAASRVEQSFAQDHRGRLEIGALELAWFAPQRIEDARLLDPSGAEVARASVDLPSLAALLGGGGKRIGKVVVVASAALVADDAGVTNLDAALEETDAARERASRPREASEPTDVGALVRELAVEVEVQVDRLSWSDSRSRALGRPFELGELALQLVAKPGEPLACVARGVLVSEGGAPLSIAAKLTDAFDAQGVNPNARFELEADVAALPSGLIDALAATDGLVAALLGERFGVAARGAGTLREGEVALDVTGDSGAVQLACALQDGLVRGSGPQALRVASTLAAEPLARALADKLPAGASLAIGPELDLRVTQLEMPLAEPISAAAMLAGLRAHVDVALDALAFRDASDPARTKSVELDGLAIALDVGPNGGTSPVVLAVKSRLAKSGALALDLTLPDLHALAEFAPGDAIEPVQARVVLSALPVPWIESWAGSELGLAQKLGSTLDADVELRAGWPKGAPANVDAMVQLRSPRGATRLSLNASVADPARIAARIAAGALPAASATFGVVDDGIATAFVPAEAADVVRGVVGAKIDGSLKCEPVDGAKPASGNTLSLQLRAERLAVAGSVRVVERTLRSANVDGDGPLTVVLRPTGAMLDRYVAASLPTGAKLAFAAAEPQLELALDGVTLPLDAWMPEAGHEPAQLADVVRRTAARVQVALPSLRYEHPPLSGAAKPVPVALDELVVAATLAPGQPLVAHVTGKVAGEQTGRIALDLTCADAGAFASEGAELPPMDLNASIANLPTALVDALAGQEGLLVDVLGPVIELKAAGKFPSPPGEPLKAELRSANASLDLVALLEDKRMVATGEQGLKATLPLTPLFSRRVVGNLVPLLVNASKPQGAKPLALDVSVFSLPLDGDLRQLNGTVALDLGEVVYDLLPGLSSSLSSFGVAAPTKKSFVLEPLVIPIVNGVARYERLPLSISGETVVFKGSFDLATRELGLSTELPLKALGSKVEGELDKVREYLDPNLLVPIEIKGTWNKPKISLGREFMDKVVKKAAEGALKKGLFDLLDDQLKKDKKKDGDK